MVMSVYCIVLYSSWGEEFVIQGSSNIRGVDHTVCCQIYQTVNLHIYIHLHVPVHSDCEEGLCTEA